MDEDFELGNTEHYSHDHKQMLFEYFDLSEVRAFITNHRGKPERMEPLKSVAKKIWVGTDVLAIQTGWELSDLPPLAEEIAGGKRPQIEPFCIIDASSLEKDTDFVCEYIERNGILIEDMTEWDH